MLGRPSKPLAFQQLSYLMTYQQKAAAKRSWEKKVDECMKKELILEENMKTLYSINWGQCTELMRQRIQALPEYKKMPTHCHSSRQLGTRLSTISHKRT